MFFVVLVYICSSVSLLPFISVNKGFEYAPNRLSAGALSQTHWGSLHRSPDPLAGLVVGPTGNGKEGGEGKRREGREGTGNEGRASRNAQIQSWQAYPSDVPRVLSCSV